MIEFISKHYSDFRINYFQFKIKLFLVNQLAFADNIWIIHIRIIKFLSLLSNKTLVFFGSQNRALTFKTPGLSRPAADRLKKVGDRARTSLIRDSLWFEIESNNHDSPKFVLILIRRWIMIRAWIGIRDESKSNRIKMNEINLNCESKLIKIKMNRESKIKWFAHVNQIFGNRFGPSAGGRPSMNINFEIHH